MTDSKPEFGNPVIRWVDARLPVFTLNRHILLR